MRSGLREEIAFLLFSMEEFMGYFVMPVLTMQPVENPILFTSYFILSAWFFSEYMPI